MKQKQLNQLCPYVRVRLRAHFVHFKLPLLDPLYCNESNFNLLQNFVAK
jgi:hypothetical protein